MWWWNQGWACLRGSLYQPSRSGVLASGSRACRVLLLLAAASLSIGNVVAEESAGSGRAINRVTMDVYIRPDSERCEALSDFLQTVARQRRGLHVVIHDVVEDMDARRRLYELSRQHQVKQVGLPAVHVMDQFRVGYNDSATGQEAVAGMLSIEVFTRSGCNRCRDAKIFLRSLAERWPALRFLIRDIVTDTAARDRLMKLARDYNVHAPSVPAFHLCRQLKIGYLGPATTGRNIEAIIRRAARSPSAAQSPEGNSSAQPQRDVRPDPRTSLRRLLPLTLAWIQLPTDSDGADSDTILDDAPSEMEFDADDMDPLPELPGDEFDQTGDRLTPPPPKTHDWEMEVPYFGRLNADNLGMPIFTFMVGLVDGFNPCAMWVLMFLLSVLVNIRERSKIIVIAGTFVLVSGLAYFAFMAAWLNVFMLVGLDRPAQVILGSVAIVIGAVNVKDFFAFGKGISFSIPEAAKPGIYARVRRIVAAKQLWAALAGAIVLAVLVNMIELLCTAGLPAMYTEILTLHQYSPLVNYLYLGLYIVAYMLDDSLMVGVVVVTMSRKKLQEGQGRWLKLLSGVVILSLGLVMIARPHWLV